MVENGERDVELRAPATLAAKAPRVEQGAESVMIFRVHKGRRAMHAHASTGIQQWRPAQVATF